MKDRNGYTTLQMLVVIGILGIFTLVIMGTTSYAFKDQSVEYYNEKEHLIIKQAKLYGEKLESLKNEGSLIITVNDLINDGYYIPDDDSGNVVDPRNSKANLNGLKIKLTYESDGNIKAEVLDEE